MRARVHRQQTARPPRGFFCVAFALLAACDSGAEMPAVDAGVVDSAGNSAPPIEIPDIYDFRAKPCVEYEGGFVEPKLAAASGAAQLNISSNMQPVGYDVRVEMSVLDAPGGDLDQDVAGDYTVEAEPALTVVTQGALKGGRATLMVRFSAPGTYTLHVGVSDGSGRSGSLQVLAYRTQLQVWEVVMSDDELAQMLDDPYSDMTANALLSIDGEGFPATVRLHGGSSRLFPKPSFRFELTDGKFADGSDHAIVRAEYADKSLLRNYLGLELFRSASKIPAPRARPVHLRVNGRYNGVAWHVERIDDDFLRSHGLFPGSMYEADPELEYRGPGANLTALSSLDEYRAVYDQKNGPAQYEDLIALIEEVLALPNTSFQTMIDAELNVDWYLRYMAIMTVLQNQDHIRKNYYLYRDTGSSREPRWLVFPWDLDLAMGHLWTEENDVLDETLFVDGDPYVGKRVAQHEFYNQLMTQLWLSPGHDERFWQQIDQVLDVSFDANFVSSHIDAFTCRATPDLLADRLKRANNVEYATRVQELRNFVSARRTFLRQNDPYNH